MKKIIIFFFLLLELQVYGYDKPQRDHETVPVLISLNDETSKQIILNLPKIIKNTKSLITFGGFLAILTYYRLQVGNQIEKFFGFGKKETIEKVLKKQKNIVKRIKTVEESAKNNTADLFQIAKGVNKILQDLPTKEELTEVKGELKDLLDVMEGFITKYNTEQATMITLINTKVGAGIVVKQ
jgi:hypothetical protein